MDSVSGRGSLRIEVQEKRSTWDNTRFMLRDYGRWTRSGFRKRRTVRRATRSCDSVVLPLNVVASVYEQLLVISFQASRYCDTTQAYELS